MSRQDKNASKARYVEGLEYKYPFRVGDVCYFITNEGKVLTRNKLIVKEIGVPFELKGSLQSEKDYDGHLRHYSIGTGQYVEGVVVKYDDGFDYTLGYTEIKKVSNLILTSDYDN